MKVIPVLDKDLMWPVPENRSVIRVTERQQFKKCRRRWKYAFRNRLQPINTKADARTLGTVCHAALAAYYKSLQESQNLPDVIFEERITNATASLWATWTASNLILEEDQIELGMGILDGYLRNTGGEEAHWHIHAVEQTLYARIPTTNVWLQGTPDLIISDYTGALYVYDHKTYRSFLTEEQVEFDDQQTLYIWLLAQNGIKVRSAIYNMLRKKVPREPQLLVKGGLSKNKAIDTDKVTYLAAIHKHGLDPMDYMEFLNELPDKEFFKREQVVRSVRQIQTVEEMLIAEARDMTYKNIIMYPNYTRDCTMCDFKELCRTEQDQGDVETTIKNLYSPINEVTLNRRES